MSVAPRRSTMVTRHSPNPANSASTHIMQVPL
jgi:hypothetical protein